MKQAVFTLLMAISVVPRAQAEGTLGERVDSVTQTAREAIESIKTSASKQVEQVADSASNRAGEVADKTSETADQAKQSAREKAKEAAGYGEQLTDKVSALARSQADQLGDAMSGWLARGKRAAADTLTGVRHEARDWLIGAAEALDRQNAEARSAARRAHWEELKTRFRLDGERPSRALSEELRDHEYRVARLTRVRTLADQADDARAVTRSERLLEAEHGRHRRRVLALRESERATDGEDP